MYLISINKDHYEEDIYFQFVINYNHKFLVLIEAKLDKFYEKCSNVKFMYLLIVTMLSLYIYSL